MAAVGDVEGIFLMAIGHVTFGVLPLPLFSFHSFALAQSYGSIFSLSASVSPPMLHWWGSNFGLSVLLIFYLNMI